MAMERKWRCEKLDFPVDLEIYRPLEDTKHTLEIIFIESFSIISTSKHPPLYLHTYSALFYAKKLCFQITSFCFVLRIFCLQNFCLSTPFLPSPSVLSGVDHFRFLEKAQIPQESRAREYRNDLHPPGASFSTIWKLYIARISVPGPLFQPFENGFKLCNFCNSLKLKFQTRCQHL